MVMNYDFQYLGQEELSLAWFGTRVTPPAKATIKVIRRKKEKEGSVAGN